MAVLAGLLAAVPLIADASTKPGSTQPASTQPASTKPASKADSVAEPAGTKPASKAHSVTGPGGPGPAPAGGITGDTRTVTEPAVPSATCVTLTADLTISGRTFPAALETTPPDTYRLQKALDSCTTATGTVAVKLVAGGGHAAFLTGPLTIHQGEVLLIDSGVTLYGSRNPQEYQVNGKPGCGTLSTGTGGCTPLIQVSGADAGIEGIRDAAGTDGRIDARGDQTILGTGTTWWELARQAQQRNLDQNNPRLIQATRSDNFTMYHVDLLNAASFHVVYQGGNGFTAWAVRIRTPADARNTDGIDPAGATNVTIAESFIQDGDDGVAIKGGQPTSNITVRNNHFYGTHGISIGSETNGGVTNVLVRDNTLAGADSSGVVSGSSAGIRIKSSPRNGGRVTAVAYLDTCETGVKTPLDFDTHYANGTGTSIPSFTGIVVDGVRAVKSPANARSVFTGFSAGRPLGLTLTDVSLDVTASTAEFADLRLGGSNLTPSGKGVAVTRVPAGGAVPVCTFPAFPAG